MSRGRYGRSELAVSGDRTEHSREWERRPGGMVVQLRDPNVEATVAGPMIRLRVLHGATVHEVFVKANSSFGDLKKALVQNIGLHPQQQRLLFKGKERSDIVYLNEAGVKDKSKVTVVEDIAGRDRWLLESRRNEAIVKANKTIAEVKQEVKKLAEQIVKVEGAVSSDKKLPDEEITGRIELLMCQLVKLDGLKVEGDAKTQRAILMRKVQKYVERLDALKAMNDSSEQKPSPKPVPKPNLKPMPKAISNPGTVKNTGGSIPWDNWDSILSGDNTQLPKSSPALTTGWEIFD